MSRALPKGKSKSKGEGKPSTGRKDYGENENIELVSEVEGRCPKCGKKLVNKRSIKLHKDYELAHIYPLNPTKEEIELLQGLPRLSEDPNHPYNILALCIPCHNEFDNPRTIEGYLEVCAIKRILIRKSAEREDWLNHPLADEITKLLRKLIDIDSDTENIEIEYDPHTIDEKTKPEIPFAKREHIKLDVQLHYGHIKRELANIECEIPGTSRGISLQIKLYYNTLSSKKHSKLYIYDAMVHWIRARSKIEYLPACEAVASFFVQNCEIFEASQ